MYPTNHYMDPYHSHYRSHSPYPYYPPQGWEIPSGHPRKMDSSCRPPTYGPWPYNAVMHHPHPSEFHCCCNHTYPPDYYSFRPPLPQELPPPHLCYHGPFPQHSNASLYFVPPHQYPVDQMPHGYDKLKSHCCGCPNHVCDGAEKSNVKIKEENPDVKLESEQKDSDGGTIIRHPKNQYPFIWLPSGNMEGKENGKRFELSPQLLNGWAPVKSTGDAKRQEQDNQEEQFHWPIVWMPARYDEPKQKDKEMKEMEEVPKAPNNSEEAPRSPKIKIIPLSWFENDHRDQKPAARDGSGDHSDRAGVKSQPAVAEHQGGMTLEASPKTSPAVPKIEKDERKPAKENKTIPVEPKREIDEKKASTYRTIPVIKESDEKKTSISEKKEAKKASNAEKLEENGKTKHSESSTAKHAKLPPVCLRLDPLPRRKSGNGSSRSPSPPTSKDGDKAKKDVKEAQSQNLEPKQSDTKHITMHEVKEKSPDGMKGVGVSNKTVQAASAEHSQKEEVPISKHDQKVQTDCTNIGSQENAGGKTSQGGAMQENTNGESLKGCDKSTKEDETVIGSEAAKDATRTCRTNLSEQDAAARIQCAYRGYDVRRWQPLDKLRKIRDVHEQMQGVKKQLQCLEDSCKKLTEKEQVSIGETIMNLLLKLDTIQGLHQSVREARKSVARELVCLQEKLDTLCKKSSGEFNHTKSDEEKLESSEKNLTPDSSENIVQIAAPTVTTEASDKKSQQGAVEPGMVEEPSSVDSVEPCDAVPAVVPMEMDAGASEQQNQKEEEPCTTTMEEAHEKGKAAGQVEFQVASSIDMMSDAALPEHPTENKEHVIEGSNAVSVEQLTEEKPAVEGEWKEVPLVNSTESFPDAASSGDSSELKQCTASTEQNLHAESNTGLPSASTEDVNATAAAASVESGVATEKDVPLDSQMQGSAAVESLELKHDVSPAEENQQTELRGQVVHLEDPSLPLQVEEQHDLIPAEAGDNSMLERAVDTMQDSTKEPDGTPEASMNNMTLSASAYTEKPDLEPTLESDSAPEQTVLDETDDPVQCRVYGKDEPPRVDQKAEPAVDKLTGASVNGGDSHLEESMKKPDIQESYPNLAEEADDSCELSCGHEGGITGHERSEAEVCSESQTDSQKEHADLGVSETYECTETRKEAPEDVSGANSAEDAGVQGSLMEKCTEMPKDAQVGVPGANSTEDVDVQVSVTERRAEDAPVSVAGANPAEEEADKLKRTVAMNSENKASEETLSAAVTPDDGMKDNNEKKLAEENQQLKELLQKLLASGNDQMGVITDLSEKVKALERKLARKKRPKVRVHKPSRHATAKVH